MTMARELLLHSNEQITSVFLKTIQTMGGSGDQASCFIPTPWQTTVHSAQLSLGISWLDPGGPTFGTFPIFYS